MAVLRCFLLFGALVVPGPLPAQDVRAQLAIEPAELFSAMVAMTQRSDWPRIESAFDVLVPLVAEVDGTESRNTGPFLKAAIDSRDPDRTRDALLRFVAFAVSDVLIQAATEESPLVRRDLVRTAFGEFVSVSPILKSLSFDLHRQIERDFRAAYRQADRDPSDFAELATGLVGILVNVGAHP